MEEKTNNTPKDYRETNPNPFLAILYEEMDKKGITSNDLLDLTGYDSGSLFSQKAMFPVDPNKQGPFKKAVIRRLYLACDIDCQRFLLNEKDEESWLDKYAKTDQEKEAFFTHAYWKKIEKYKPIPQSLINFISFESHDKNNNPDLLDTYEILAKDYFETAKKRIEVFELLFKGDNSTPGFFKSYRDAQAKIFEAIEKALETNSSNDDFKYVRIFNLSRSEKIFPKKSRAHRLRAFAAEASKESLLHIRRCLKEHPGKCEFYIDSVHRFRHYAIVDDRLFSEDYVTVNNAVVPDFLFIDDITLKSKANKIKKELRKKISTDTKYPINDGDVTDQVEKALNYIKYQVIKRKEAINLIEEKFPERNSIKSIEELLDREKDLITTLANQIVDLDVKKRDIT